MPPFLLDIASKINDGAAEMVAAVPPVQRWAWDATSGPTRLSEALAGPGVAWLALPPDLVDELRRAPQSGAEALLGERLLAVERQPIRPLPDGRTFATSTGPAPFHTDSQRLDGTPPHLQLMLCLQSANAGGENRFLDAWALLDTLREQDPRLYAALFAQPRRLPFVFGDMLGPTVSLRGDSLVFTQPAQMVPGDPLVAPLARWLAAAPVLALTPDPHDLIVIHNHRWLHGRAGFDDERREFLRLLGWRFRPYPAPAFHLDEAGAARHRLARQTAREAGDVRRRLGLQPRLSGQPGTSDPAAARLAVVMEMLRGVPPGQLARREQVPEDELYRWREALVGAALDALDDRQLGSRDDHERRCARALGLPAPARKETP